MRNLEAVELGLREALFKDGRHLLQQLYQQPKGSVPGDIGQPGEKCHRVRTKQIHTLFGPVVLQRRYYYCPQRGQGRAPLDEALGLVNSFSPALVRLSARAAAQQGYEAASEDLRALAAVAIEGRQIQRLVNRIAPRVAVQLQESSPESADPIAVMYVAADGTGVPMVADELAGRKGKQPDGSAKTREAKLGCVFTQTRVDEHGQPMRDYQSTTYVGNFETARDFGVQLRAEALRRGLGRAKQIVFLGDGAAWVWEIAQDCFGGAIQILDLYHALERLHKLCEGLYGASGPWAQKMEKQWTQRLREDAIAEVIVSARRRLESLGGRAEESLAKQIAYFEHHQGRMLYKTYQEQGLFYGSGVVEAGCKSVIGQRLKESGMFWTETGATRVLHLRCALKGNRWDECWDRLNQSDYLRIRVAA